ncbi:MAG: sugar phosphate isomerase/epimerase [Planctomycetes bacterium]|nr:sugar phosphate isomerase/epimerase [Planctomycetota bacterium]
MKIAIDSYSYHRYFGEVYPDQQDPGVRWRLADFLRRARELGVGGVSLETCFLESLDEDYLSQVKALLDEQGFDRALAWGHPDGLEAGRSEAAWRDLNALIPKVRRSGATVLRIVASSLRFLHEPHEPQIRAVVKMLRESVRIAAGCGVVLAIENHLDYTSAEILRILEEVGSDSLKVNFDTGNALRMLEDPAKAARCLAPHIAATHIKDVDVCRGVPPDAWYFFSSVAAGTGLVDMAGVVRALAEGGYEGLLAVESDHHKDGRDEDRIVAESVAYLKGLLRPAA